MNKDYYTCSYPVKIKTKKKKIRHIVDNTPEECKSIYFSRMIDGRPSDVFYFHPPLSIKYGQSNKSYIIPGSNGEIIKEIHKSNYTPQKFNEKGIIRENTGDVER